MSVSSTPVLNYYAAITSIGTVDMTPISVLITKYILWKPGRTYV